MKPDYCLKAFEKYWAVLTYQTKPNLPELAKPNLLKSTYKTNLPKQTYQTQPTKSNLPSTKLREVVKIN